MGDGSSCPATTTGFRRQHSQGARSNGSPRCTRRPGWSILPEVIEGTRGGYRILASHYLYSGDSHGTDRHTTHRPRGDEGVPLLHGHTHALDHGPHGHEFHVGVDAHDFAPIRFAVIDEWIRSLPGIETRLQAASREARAVLADVVGGEAPGSDALFYMQGYNELVIVLEELLDALPHDEPNG